MSRKILVITVVVLVLGALSIGSWYIFNKPHRSLDQVETITISADSLLSAYLQDEKVANTLYLDKALVINGEIADLTVNQSGQTVILLKTKDPMAAVVCTLQVKPEAPLKKGMPIKVKGFCSGFMADVVLRDCHIILEN
jgi:hypothetical protein